MSMMRSNLYVEYPIDTPQGIHEFMMNRHYIDSAIEKGDFDAIAMKVDFDIAFQRTAITDRQFLAIDLIYHQGLTQREAGEIMGIYQQAVQQMLNLVLQRIAESYTRTYNKGVT